MTPGQLRQHAAQRFCSVNKQDWADKAVQGLRDAADQIERLESEMETLSKVAGLAVVERAAPVIQHIFGGRFDPNYVSGPMTEAATKEAA